MYDLLCKFEDIIVMKTIMDNIDLNFIGVEDLEEIAGYAEELGIEIDCVNLDDIYNSEYDLITDIYYTWYENVNNKYLDIKNGLLKLI